MVFTEKWKSTSAEHICTDSCALCYLLRSKHITSSKIGEILKNPTTLYALKRVTTIELNR